MAEEFQLPQIEQTQTTARRKMDHSFIVDLFPAVQPLETLS
jgi:hypothetical protein